MQPYLLRRQQLQHTLAPGMVIIPNAPEVVRNNDCCYPYRFNSYFYYLTGFTEPDAVLVQIIGEQPQVLLFCHETAAECNAWDDTYGGIKAAKAQVNVDAVYAIASIEEHLLPLLQDQPRIYFPLGEYVSWDHRLTKLLRQSHNLSRKRQRECTIIDIRPTLGEMRLIKDATEITLMRQAAQINTCAHLRAMQFTQPNLYEYSVEAEIVHEYYRLGARAVAYNTIVASGANACTLHYTKNTALLKKEELLLVDAGCEVAGYASDVTRTFPINGYFSAVQKTLYEIVLAAQLAAIATLQPGASVDIPQQAALRILVQGLIDLKLCQGSVDGVIESGSYRQFYMHSLGHWLGLDVHDPGSYYQKQPIGRNLEPGMVMTIEPGLYIRAANNVPEHLANIGIRIEDDILITPAGCENLTMGIPKTVADIEAAMKQGIACR